MRKHALLSVTLAALLWLAQALPIGASPTQPPTTIYLRRATFDPLQQTPQVSAALRAAPASRLLLVQLNQRPDAQTAARLRAAGLEPLAYVPDNAYLVRSATARHSLSPADWLRWSGPFAPSYRHAPDLDAPAADTLLDLRLFATSDADLAALQTAIGAAGGTLTSSAPGLTGISVRLSAPGSAVATLAQRDDVLWIERAFTPQLFNDKGREILGVTAARQQLSWLTGAGQIVAVTDSGLDVQSDITGNRNPDFPPEKIARGFSNHEMEPVRASCASNEWTDRNGHGTHVSGTVLGSGARQANGQFAGMAPAARLVIQSVSSGGNSLDCLPSSGTDFLSKAYDAGARVQNASWGAPTGIGDIDFTYGAYDTQSQQVDQFLWEHPEHLLVVAAGNEGDDKNANGVIDPDSINTPGTAKNVLTVGATESDRPPTQECSETSFFHDCTWELFSYEAAPLSTDPLSDNPNGMAAFSSRGPTDDGRIKPEIAAPGVAIISTASHYEPNMYWDMYNEHYAYNLGTSMATPMISGLAALVRQWLAQEQEIASPSAALVKALLLNGATDISPGQYGTGAQREIPSAWPNSVAGWGRANLLESIGLGESSVWLVDQADGLQTGGAISYTVTISETQPSFRATLVWTDYPGSPTAAKALVNDLDLEVVQPGGAVVRGNASATLPSACRAAGGADRCNNSESVAISTPVTGTYTLWVRAAVVPNGPQPFALVAQAPLPTPAAPTLEATGGSAITLQWAAVANARRYELQESRAADFTTVDATFTTSTTALTLVLDLGTYHFRVRACNSGGCSAYSNIRQVQVTSAPQHLFLPLSQR